MKLISKPQVDIRGVPFDDVTLDLAVSAIIDHVKNGGEIAAVYTPNSEIVQRCVEDGPGELYRIINSAELILPDSVGVIKVAKIFGTPLTGKVPGVEVGEAVLEKAAKEGLPVFFLGGKPGVAETARDRMTEKYAGLRVVGAADGYFAKSGAETAAIIDKIAAARPEILYVCLGAPSQERWIYENRSALSVAGVRIALALGGSLDIYAGTARRAPRIFIALGLEWLYRLIREPSRIGRMMALPRFYLGCKREARKNKKK